MSQPISGHVSRYDGKRRSVWRVKYRLPDGRQVKKTLGPAWTARGRPPAGYFTKRTAEGSRSRDRPDACSQTSELSCRSSAKRHSRAEAAVSSVSPIEGLHMQVEDPGSF